MRCGCSSVGRALSFQVRCRGFEPRRPLQEVFQAHKSSPVKVECRMRVVEGLRAFTHYSAGACTEVSNNLYRRFLVPFLAV